MSTVAEQVAEATRNGSPAPHAPQRLWTESFVELLVTQFVFGLGFSTFNLLPKYLHTTLNASASQIGLAMGIALIAGVAAAAPAAIWLARGARRLPVLIAVSLLTASAAAFAFVHSVGFPLLALRACQGFAFALLQSAIVTRAAEVAPEHRLGEAIGLTGLAGLVTNALAPLFAEPVARAYGWQVVFALAAVMGLAALIPAARIQDAPASHQPARPGALLQGHLPAVLYAAAVCGASFGVMFTFTQPLAIERGARDVGAMFSGYALTAAGFRLVFGGVADRYGRRRVSIAALLAYAVVVAFGAAASPALLFALGLGLGAAHGSLYPALSALSFEGVARPERGTVAAAFAAAFNLGYAASVLGLGPVADRWGYPVLFVGAAALTLTGALALAARPRERPAADRLTCPCPSRGRPTAC